MRISGYSSPAPAPQIDDAGEGELDAEVEGALLKRGQSEMKQEGAAAVSLIDKAGDLGVNKPLSWGPVGRIINVKA